MAFTNLTVEDNNIVTEGVLTFTRNSSTTDFTSHDILDVLFRFIGPKPDNTFVVWPPDILPDVSDTIPDLEFWNSSDRFCQIPLRDGPCRPGPNHLIP